MCVRYELGPKKQLTIWTLQSTAMGAASVAKVRRNPAIKERTRRKCFALRTGYWQTTHSELGGKDSPNVVSRYFGPALKLYLIRRCSTYRGAGKSLVRPGRKQARKHVRDARDFNNIETRAVIKAPSSEGKAPREIHAFLTETLACFLPGRARTYQH